jgi:hypothetical protein
MSWKISRLSTSLMGLLREADVDNPVELERIRSSMVGCIGQYMDAQNDQRTVWRKLLAAQDIQTLWYLRSDVMHLLCDHLGEHRASDKLHAITELFRGHIPAAQYASARRRA